MTTPSPTVMTLLKDSTKEQHTRAERHPMQADLVRGQLPIEAYCRYLAQLRHVHEALESSLVAGAHEDPRLGRVVRESQFRLDAIDADLAHFGKSDVESEPTTATSGLIRCIDDVAANEPIALLGYHYVLEGSTNGGRFIARALCGAYGLKPGEDGTRYLDPYGVSQTDEWLRFREDMESLELSGEETERLIETASEMFEGITAIMDSLSGTREPATT